MHWRYLLGITMWCSWIMPGEYLTGQRLVWLILAFEIWFFSQIFYWKIYFLSRAKSYILKPLKTRLLVCPSVNLLMNVPGFHLILLVSYQLVSYLWIALRLRKILNMCLDKKSVTLVMVSKLFIFLFPIKYSTLIPKLSKLKLVFDIFF